MKREGFKSRLGFLLVSAGCAIGIGNVWKFPYITGQNGGGLFVLFYLLFLVIMGAPVLTMELAVGRGSRQSAVKGYKALEPKGSKWHLHGWVCIVGCLMLMMFYTTVSGWMLNYAVKFTTGVFDNVTSEGVGGVFDSMLQSPAQSLGYMAITVVIGVVVCSIGLQNGIEKVSKVMMLCLLGLMVMLAVNSMTLEKAGEGIAFYLLPSVERAKNVGIGNVITAAMNQSFFTLSLGVASMEIFGSYMSKDFTLGGEALRISALDTFVAIVSGLIIFPACFAYGVQPDSGPGLIFITLPNIFNHMKMGRLWGSLFFVFMTFAAFSNVLAVFENIMAMCMDMFGWSRQKSGFINTILMLVLATPCALGFNVLSSVQLLGEGSSILDFEDLIVSNYILPLGAFVIVLFCTSRYGWGWKNFVNEADQGEGLKVMNWMRPYCTYVLPLIVILVFILGIL